MLISVLTFFSGLFSLDPAISTISGGLHVCTSCDLNNHLFHKCNFPGKPGGARNKVSLQEQKVLTVLISFLVYLVLAPLLAPLLDVFHTDFGLEALEIGRTFSCSCCHYGCEYKQSLQSYSSTYRRNK